MAGSSSPTRTTVLAVHPGAELFGSDRMFSESVRGLRAAGAHVVAALPIEGPLVADLRSAGAEVVVVPMLVLRKALLKPRAMPALLRDALRGFASAWRLIGRVRPDAVYVSTITIPLWPLVGRMRRTRTVTHVHEAEASAGRMVNRMLYLPHLASSATIANSGFARETIRRALPALARRATVVSNGVASPAAPAPPRARVDGPVRVLYVGRLSPRKGPDLVIQAADALTRRGTPASVTMLGTAFRGYEWFEDQLRRQAAEARAEVAFAGFHSDIWPFLADADVLVVPSRLDEPFGNTAVEGILALRPVVASDTSGLREAAGGYRNARLVPADDADAIAGTLADVVEAWADVVAAAADDRAEALRRHAPTAYRSAVAAEVLPPAERRRPAVRREPSPASRRIPTPAEM